MNSFDLAEKWYNSLKLVKEMGDLQNMDPCRYQKLNVYTKQSGKTVFRDYGILLEQYETKVCMKLISYKWDTIFNRNAFLAKKNSLVKIFCEA